MRRMCQGWARTDLAGCEQSILGKERPVQKPSQEGYHVREEPGRAECVQRSCQEVRKGEQWVAFPWDRGLHILNTLPLDLVCYS